MQRIDFVSDVIDIRVFILRVKVCTHDVANHVYKAVVAINNHCCWRSRWIRDSGVAMDVIAEDR
jgi:hypothetical protein